MKIKGTAIKGTVLDIQSDIALVMTTECDFIEIHRLEGLETGQEIIFSRRDIIRKGRRTGRVTLALAACLVLFFICMPLYTSFFTTTASATVAYVSLDINPSLELAVNKKCQVNEATAFNENGAKLLQSVSVNGKPVTEAVTALIKAAEEMQYLNTTEGDVVLVCLSPADNKEQNAELVSSIGDELAVVEKTKTTELKIVDGTNIQHQEAQQLGMSAGRYNLWKEDGNGNNDKLEQYKNGKLTDFIAESQSNGKINANGPKPHNQVKASRQANGRNIPPGLEKKESPIDKFDKSGIEHKNNIPQNQKKESWKEDMHNPPGLEKKEPPTDKSNKPGLEHKNNTPQNEKNKSGKEDRRNPPGLENKESSANEYRNFSLEREAKPPQNESNGRSNSSVNDKGISNSGQEA